MNLYFACKNMQVSFHIKAFFRFENCLKIIVLLAHDEPDKSKRATDYHATA